MEEPPLDPCRRGTRVVRIRDRHPVSRVVPRLWRATRIKYLMYTSASTRYSVTSQLFFLRQPHRTRDQSRLVYLNSYWKRCEGIRMEGHLEIIWPPSIRKDARNQVLNIVWSLLMAFWKLSKALAPLGNSANGRIKPAHQIGTVSCRSAFHACQKEITDE